MRSVQFAAVAVLFVVGSVAKGEDINFPNGVAVPNSLYINVGKTAEGPILIVPGKGVPNGSALVWDNDGEGAVFGVVVYTKTGPKPYPVYNPNVVGGGVGGNEYTLPAGMSTFVWGVDKASYNAALTKFHAETLTKVKAEKDEEKLKKLQASLKELEADVKKLKDEAPKAEAPKAEAPKAEAPKAEAPKTE